MKSNKKNNFILFFNLILIANILLLITNFLLFSRSFSSTLKIDPLAVTKIVNTCKEDVNWRRCYGKEIASYTAKRPITYGIEVMHQVQKIDKKTLDCHLIAHGISNNQVQQNPAKWQELLGQVTAYECIGGFIHGILETHAGLDPNFEINEKTIPEICEITKDKGKPYCSHIFGHLLAVETNGNIIEASNICQKLSDEFELEFSCHTGAFMENITRDNLVAHQLATHRPYEWKSALDQEVICKLASERAAEKACWQEITHYYHILSGKNPTNLWELCGRAPADDDRDACFIHGVTFIAGDETLKEKQTMESLCNPFSLKQKARHNRCITTIIKVLIDSSSGFSDKIINLCTNSNTIELKEKCFYELGKQLPNLIGQEKTNNVCQNAPKNYQALCKSI